MKYRIRSCVSLISGESFRNSYSVEMEIPGVHWSVILDEYTLDECENFLKMLKNKEIDHDRKKIIQELEF